MMDGLYLDIVSPEKAIFSGEVDSATLPGTMGTFSILPQHAPIVSSLKEGILIYVTNGEEHSLRILGGFIEMNNNRITACVETE